MVKGKKIQVIEIKGVGSYDLKPGQRIVDTKVIGEMIVLPRNAPAPQYAMPEYKTVIVLEITEYEQ